MCSELLLIDLFVGALGALIGAFSLFLAAFILNR